MKCATCGAEAFMCGAVQETDYRVLRTYRCNDGHDSKTFEVLASGLSKRDLETTERAASTRVAKFHRNQEILKDLSSMSSEAIGRKWNLTGARVRQLRNTVILKGTSNDDACLLVNRTISANSRATVYRMGRLEGDSEEP